MAALQLNDLGGSGPPLLLLHANGFHHAVFEPMVATLSSRFRCYAPDLPGHGDAAHVEPALWPAVDAVAAAARALSDDAKAASGGGSGAVFALGHSLGGALALAAEARAPGTFAAVYAFEPIAGPAGSGDNRAGDGGTNSGSSTSGGSGSGGGGGGGSGDDASEREHDARREAQSRALQRMALRRRAAFASPEAAAARLGAKPPFSLFHPAALRAYVRHGLRWDPAGDANGVGGGGAGGDAAANGSGSGSSGGLGGSAGSAGGDVAALSPPQPAAAGAWVLRCAPASEAKWYAALSRYAPVEAARVRCPVRIAVGAEMPGGAHSGLPRLGARLAAALPRGELRRFEALGHLGPLEAPGDVARDALEFFGRALGGGSEGGGDGGSGCAVGASEQHGVKRRSRL